MNKSIFEIGQTYKNRNICQKSLFYLESFSFSLNQLLNKTFFIETVDENFNNFFVKQKDKNFKQINCSFIEVKGSIFSKKKTFLILNIFLKQNHKRCKANSYRKT